VWGLLILLMVGAVLAHQRWAASQRRRAVHRTLEGASPAAIEALPQGELTRITGVVAPRDALLTSPIGRQPCIGYSSVIEEMHVAWRPILKSAACRAFIVTDDSGRAVVEGPVAIAEDLDEGAWMALPTSVFRQDPGGTWGSLRASVFKRMGFKPVGEDGPRESLWGWSEDLRYQEVLLKPGDRVSVLGRAKMQVDPAGHASFRDAPMLNHITGSEDAPVVVARDIVT
jgi:hypothetical protein